MLELNSFTNKTELVVALGPLHHLRVPFCCVSGRYWRSSHSSATAVPICLFGSLLAETQVDFWIFSEDYLGKGIISQGRISGRDLR